MAVGQVSGIKSPEHRLPCFLLRPMALLGINRSYEQNTEPSVDGHSALSIYTAGLTMAGSRAQCLPEGREATMGDAGRAGGRTQPRW